MFSGRNTLTADIAIFFKEVTPPPATGYQVFDSSDAHKPEALPRTGEARHTGISPIVFIHFDTYWPFHYKRPRKPFVR
ncbi:hypothetical protein BaRGS_00000512, partial [Batillaria attramentaria]